MESKFKNYLETFAIEDSVKYINIKYFKIITVAICIYLINCAILNFLPMSLINRTMLFDLILFFMLPQNLNWIIGCFALNCLNFHLIMCHPSKYVIEFLYKIIYLEDLSFFIRKHVTLKNEKKLASEIAMKHLKNCFDFMKYFVLFKCK